MNNFNNFFDFNRIAETMKSFGFGSMPNFGSTNFQNPDFSALFRDASAGTFDLSKLFFNHNSSQIFSHIAELQKTGEKIAKINAMEDIGLDEKRKQVANVLKEFSQTLYQGFINPAGVQMIKSSRDMFRANRSIWENSEIMKFSEMPLFGPYMNDLGQARDFANAWGEMLESYSEFISVFDDMENKVCAAFLDTVMKNEELQDINITWVYDTWVDSFESEYRQLMSTANYRNLYGSLVNKMMTVRGLIQNGIDRAAESMGILSKKSTDTVLGHISKLRKSNRELRDDLRQLKAEMKELKNSLPAKAPKIENSAKPKPTNSKPASKSTKK